MRSLIAVLSLAAFAGVAEAKWVKYNSGPDLDYAMAYCENQSMFVGQGYVAWGNAGHVAGAAIGNAIANAIIQSRFKKNCMAMNGWKEVRVPGEKPKRDRTRPRNDDKSN